MKNTVCLEMDPDYMSMKILKSMGACVSFASATHVKLSRFMEPPFEVCNFNFEYVWSLKSGITEIKRSCKCYE